MIGYLLDTNIASELTRDRPEPRVVHWLRMQPVHRMFLSAVTIGEIRRGIVMRDPGRRRVQLEHWLDKELPVWFQGRILSVNRAIANRWGALDGECQLRGTTLNTADGMIAATAIEHGLAVVTRNVKDFAALTVEIFNPWD